MFSFGDLESAKLLQVISFYARFFVTFMMILGSILVLSKHGVNSGPVFDFGNQIENLPDVFGNTLFAFIFHFCLAGIVYPMRPQMGANKMFLWSNIIGGGLLAVESLLAWMAFGKFNNLTDDSECPKDFKYCRI